MAKLSTVEAMLTIVSHRDMENYLYYKYFFSIRQTKKYCVYPYRQMTIISDGHISSLATQYYEKGSLS